MSRTVVTVPDVVGAGYADARRVAVAAGLLVVGVAPDGTPVPDDSAGLVVEQDPLPGEALRAGDTLQLRVGRPPGGDREPRDPDPLTHTGHGVPTDPPAERTDPDDDPDLVPA
ncbi:PASTA domain-containing protein [Nakamurella endophytica]|uniref:PASTA domain-containing protein n=1 Tax=Nakamurella endophytica TaxID=1748367 RepID=A0A917SZT1_9ACTN|nr:PASTA domain-containing protein [Nakamurella endophytica]GGM04765.1 hypothetical protein GCM10011594_26270 [Nakamurella endophytica]